MYKWMYDRMVKEYEKESKEELAQRIMTMEEIECSDRCFANQCCAGSAIYNINELFEYLQDGVSLGQYDGKAVGKIKNALSSWEYIRNGLVEMKIDTRVSEAEKNFKQRVFSAKDPYDSI